MRVMGHNAFAILVAAIVIYAIEFVIFGLLIPGEQYMAYIGNTADQLHSERMPFGAVMPILTAIGLSMVIKWRGATNWTVGAVTALWMAVLFGFGGSLYSWVYGSHETSYLAVNLAHFLVCWGAAGAILGAWK